jgi:hypothetical protein
VVYAIEAQECSSSKLRDLWASALTNGSPDWELPYAIACIRLLVSG